MAKHPDLQVGGSAFFGRLDNGPADVGAIGLAGLSEIGNDADDRPAGNFFYLFGGAYGRVEAIHGVSRRQAEKDSYQKSQSEISRRLGANWRRLRAGGGNNGDVSCLDPGRDIS